MITPTPLALPEPAWHTDESDVNLDSFGMLSDDALLDALERQRAWFGFHHQWHRYPYTKVIPSLDRLRSIACHMSGCFSLAEQNLRYAKAERVEKKIESEIVYRFRVSVQNQRAAKERRRSNAKGRKAA